MNADIAKRWAAELRSGAFKQGTQNLKYEDCDSTYHCCLGVLCELYMRETGEKLQEAVEPIEDRGEPSRYACHIFNVEYDEFPPDDVTGWAEIDDKSCIRLTEMNDDQGASFAQIADYIEANAEEL